MNKIITGACIITVSFFSSCAEKQPDQDSSLKPVVDSLNAAVPTPGSANTLTTNTVPLPGATAPATITPMSPELTQQLTTSTAAGMNPAHGQPGHRCDISVGAPLNSPASKPATPTAQSVTPTTLTPTATPTAKTITAPGMNPPHGEPGHRCEIAVGAPLNSPATKPATPTQTITPVMAPASKDSGS